MCVAAAQSDIPQLARTPRSCFKSCLHLHGSIRKATLATHPAGAPHSTTTSAFVSLSRQRGTPAAQIPIAERAARRGPARSTCPTRGFVPWRFSYAGRRNAWLRLRAAGIRKPSQNPNLSSALARPVPPGADISRESGPLVKLATLSVLAAVLLLLSAASAG
jgi:hypothetical protein